MQPDKMLSITIKELGHLKIVLSAWYSFLKDSFDSKKITSPEFTELLKTPVMYDLNKDEVELIFCGSEPLLEEFRDKIMPK